jgi:hypothetical protein
MDSVAARVFGVALALGLGAMAGACNPRLPTCADTARYATDSPAAARNLDAASYFPPGLYSTEPSWKGLEKVIPPERRDPNENPLYLTAETLHGLGEESLYARRTEPDLHVYRVLTRPGFGTGRWVSRAEERGAEQWVEHRVALGCLRESDEARGIHAGISEKELPMRTWRAIEGCMDQSFWPVAMEARPPPAAPVAIADAPRSDAGRMPGKPGPPDVGMSTEGVTTCLVEGVRGGAYHAIHLVCSVADEMAPPDPLIACVRMIEDAATP